MKIEIVDLKKRYEDERKEILKIIDKVLKKGHLVMTPEVSEFEKKITNYTGSKYCCSLNSGTDALMMALWALGVKKNDEVITSSLSFVATVGAIAHIGAKPVLIDVNEDLNINCDLIEKKINKKTRVIMPVHWTGRMCDMDKVNYLAKKYDLFIIEDSAQAMGSYYKNKHSGEFSDISAFSCHPLKNLNALGDGGFITTDNKKIYEKIKLYKNHGMSGRDQVDVFGVNSRLDTIHASILSFRLLKLKKLIAKRKTNISLYKKYVLTDKIKFIDDSTDSKSSYTIFNVLCEYRNELKNYLDQNGIQSLIYYGKPLHFHKPMKKYGYKVGDYPKAEQLCKKVLALPHNQYITEKQIKYVCSKINNFYKSLK